MAPLDEVVHETFTFTCKRCDETWVQEFEVHRHVNADGQQSDHYYRNGLPCAAPWSGYTCPNCGGLRVTVVPSSAHRPGEPDQRVQELEARLAAVTSEAERRRMLAERERLRRTLSHPIAGDALGV